MLLWADFMLFGKLVIVGLPCAGLSGPSADSPSANDVSSAVTCIVVMLVDLVVEWVWIGFEGLWAKKSQDYVYRDTIIMRALLNSL